MYTTARVAERVGVSKNTLLRWLRDGLLRDVDRDARGWREWSADDVARAKRFRKAYAEGVAARRRGGTTSKADYAKSAAESMAAYGHACLPRNRA